MPLFILVSAVSSCKYDIFPRPLTDISRQGIRTAVHKAYNIRQIAQGHLLRHFLLRRLQDGGPDPLDHILEKVVFHGREGTAVPRRIHRLQAVDIEAAVLLGSGKAHTDMVHSEPGKNLSETDIRPVYGKPRHMVSFAAVIVFEIQRPLGVRKRAGDPVRDLSSFRNVQNQNDLVREIRLILAGKNPVDRIRIRTPLFLFLPFQGFLLHLPFPGLVVPGDPAHLRRFRIRNAVGVLLLLPFNLLLMDRNHQPHILQDIQVFVDLGVCHVSPALNTGVIPDPFQLRHIVGFHIGGECKGILLKNLLDCFYHFLFPYCIRPVSGSS